MALPLEQYGMIGDCQTAALVGLDGSIDWLCVPWFDSGAVFASLLGEPANGRWLVAPQEPATSVRRNYRDDTLILETTFENSQGAVTIIDFMPPRSHEPDLVRIVKGLRGTVDMQMELIMRFDYGSVVPWVQRTNDGLRATAGPDALLLHTPVKMHGKDKTTLAEFQVAAGDEVPFVLVWYASHLKQPRTIDPLEALHYTESWWHDWSARCNYQGPWRDAVVRSLITLKALTFSPAGGMVAAPTTSLPEKLGGVRNWDYRYCWLRDSSFTLYALLNSGYIDEAKAFRDWLLRAVAGDPGDLQIMYGIFGQRRLTELELPWLAGYENSRPVRTGNAASGQHQLDVYGEVLDMLSIGRRHGLPESDDAWNFEVALLEFLEGNWTQPDEGIWEVRGPRRQFTHSKVMAWVAFDRAIKAVESGLRQGPVKHWREIRAQIHDEVCQQGYNEKLNSFVQYYGSDLLDASLLMIPLVGFLPIEDQRMQGTVAAIGRDLMRDGFIHRYNAQQHVENLPPGEGTFILCSFWYIDNLVLLGRKEEAIEMFERLLAIRNDLGLLAEEYDPADKRMLGNFPQAFSHIGLVNSARNLADHEGPAEDRPKS
ncbi:MAG: glycoside hydrolase family 15 protein [Pirellulales bacterium]